MQLSLGIFLKLLNFSRQGKPEDKENGNKTNINEMKEICMNLLSQKILMIQEFFVLYSRAKTDDKDHYQVNKCIQQFVTN